MSTWVSFTSVWKAFYKGDIDLLETDRYAFGCDRRHVFRSDGLVPKEVTWVRSLMEIERDAIPENELSSDLLKKWEEFKSILAAADSKGQVDYRVGNYSEYVEAHSEAKWLR